MTRFSVYQPKSTEWHASNESVERDAYLEYLYSDDRMSFRLHTFLELSLPLLERACIGFNYIHVVQYSSEMPEKFLKILKLAEEKYTFLKLVEVNQVDRYTQVWDVVKEFFLST